jgi:hypothetical protein
VAEAVAGDHRRIAGGDHPAGVAVDRDRFVEEHAAVGAGAAARRAARRAGDDRAGVEAEQRGVGASRLDPDAAGGAEPSGTPLGDEGAQHRGKQEALDIHVAQARERGDGAVRLDRGEDAAAVEGGGDRLLGRRGAVEGDGDGGGARGGRQYREPGLDRLPLARPGRPRDEQQAGPAVERSADHGAHRRRHAECFERIKRGCAGVFGGRHGPMLGLEYDRPFALL